MAQRFPVSSTVTLLLSHFSLFDRAIREFSGASSRGTDRVKAGHSRANQRIRYREVNDDSVKLPLRNCILQWQKKYGVVDCDPILACLELFEIYFIAIRPKSSDSRPPTFEEFRSSLELLDQRSKGFTKQAAEVIQEMRPVPDFRRRFRAYHVAALFVATVAPLLAGLLVGERY